MSKDEKADGSWDKGGQLATYASKDGHFRRPDSSFRDHIGPHSEFKAEKGRYQLYVSYGCPWATRTLIMRKLKGLEDFIDIACVYPFMTALGWSFYPPIRGPNGEYPDTKGEVGTEGSMKGVTADPLYGAKFLREIYFKADPNYSGRFTVPVLWDKKTETIVNNESSEIIRMFNNEFNDSLPKEYAELDFYPKALRAEIDEQNSWVYDKINNGVYKSGFASTQEAYEANVVPLFEALDKLEKILDGGKEFVVGNQLTEADVRLFVTIIRFDVAYVGNFKCNLGTIRGNYPNLNRWMKNLYWNYPAFKDETNFEHIKFGYYASQPQVNPTRIIPIGPIPNIEPL